MTHLLGVSTTDSCEIEVYIIMLQWLRRRVVVFLQFLPSLPPPSKIHVSSKKYHVVFKKSRFQTNVKRFV